MQKQWLKDWPWETVETINLGLCKEKGMGAKPKPAGYESARELWEDSCGKALSLHEALAICRQAHQLCPFAYYNGNTFAAVGRTLVQEILCQMPPDKAQVFRSVVGHYIAGTAGDEELEAALEMTNEQLVDG